MINFLAQYWPIIGMVLAAIGVIAPDGTFAKIKELIASRTGAGEQAGALLHVEHDLKECWWQLGNLLAHD